MNTGFNGSGGERGIRKGSLSEWLEEVKHERGDKATLERYENITAEFCKYMGATADKSKLSEVTTEQVRSYLGHRRTKCSASTTNFERKILSVFFRRAIKNEQLRFNRVLPVKPFKAREGEEMKRRAFTVDDLRLLYRKAPAGFWRYMIVGGFYSGFRMGDLITSPCPPWTSASLSGFVSPRHAESDGGNQRPFNSYSNPESTSVVKTCKARQTLRQSEPMIVSNQLHARPWGQAGGAKDSDMSL